MLGPSSASATFVESYLARLPDGLDSYPEVQTKASIVKLHLRGLPRERLAAMLPPELHEYLASDLPPSLWIPDAKANCVFLAARDAYCPDDEAFRAHSLERNVEYLSGPFFRAVLKILSPERLMKTAGLGWNQAHRGLPMELSVRKEGPRSIALATLRPPADLVPRLVAEGYLTAYQAILDHHGVRDLRLRTVEFAPTRIVMEASWS